MVVFCRRREGAWDSLCQQMRRCSDTTVNCRREVGCCKLLSEGCCVTHPRQDCAVVRTRDPEIRALRIESLSPYTGHAVSQDSCPNHGTWLIRSRRRGKCLHDAKERLRKSLQSCLRQRLLHLVILLDTSEVGHLETLGGATDSSSHPCARLESRRARLCGAVGSSGKECWWTEGDGTQT